MHSRQLTAHGTDSILDYLHNQNMGIGVSLKGPKHEIFESGFFTEIRPVLIGDLGTGEKNEIS